jgi:hypothetical protein
MKYQKRFPIFALVVIAALLLLQCGCCTMTGMVIGSVVDNKKPERKSKQGLQLTEIKPGTQTFVTLDDSSMITGKFARVVPLDHNQFVDRYANFRELDSAHTLLPAIGDTVSFLPIKGQWLRARLLDVSCQDDNSKWRFRFTAEQLDSGGVRNYPLNQIAALRTTSGGIVPGQKLSNLILDSGGILPFTAIEIVKDSTKQQVPIVNIAQLTVPSHHHGWLVGALIGVALDVTVWSAAIAMQKSMEGGL